MRRSVALTCRPRLSIHPLLTYFQCDLHLPNGRWGVNSMVSFCKCTVCCAQSGLDARVDCFVSPAHHLIAEWRLRLEGPSIMYRATPQTMLHVGPRGGALLIRIQTYPYCNIVMIFSADTILFSIWAYHVIGACAATSLF